MKKIISIFSLIGLVFLLSGCGKNSDVAFCDNIEPKLNSYENGEMTKEEFIDLVKTNYDKYCTNRESDLCSSISHQLNFPEQFDNSHVTATLFSIDCQNARK